MFVVALGWAGVSFGVMVINPRFNFAEFRAVDGSLGRYKKSILFAPPFGIEHPNSTLAIAHPLRFHPPNCRGSAFPWKVVCAQHSPRSVPLCLIGVVKPPRLIDEFLRLCFQQTRINAVKSPGLVTTHQKRPRECYRHPDRYSHRVS